MQAHPALPAMLDGNLDNLPALCASAERALAEVKTIGEVQHIMSVMEAARVYAQKHRASIELQALACKIVILAERRISLELQAAAERKQIATSDGSTHHRPKNGEAAAVLLARPPTLRELGIHPGAAFEMRKSALLTPAEIEQVMRDVVARGKVPSKAAFHKAAEAKIAHRQQRRQQRQQRREADRPAGDDAGDTAPRPSPGRAKPGATPIGTDRPPHLIRLSLWLSTGTTNFLDAPQFADCHALAELARRHGVDLDPAGIARLTDFLADLATNLAKPQRQPAWAAA